jgi:hypothetical protein
VNPSYFSIPDGLKFTGQRTLFESWKKALTPPTLCPLQENTVGEASHNRERSSHSPFLHIAPVQCAHALDAGYQSDRVHLCRR